MSGLFGTQTRSQETLFFFQRKWCYWIMQVSNWHTFLTDPPSTAEKAGALKIRIVFVSDGCFLQFASPSSLLASLLI